MLSNIIHLDNSAVRPSWANGFARGPGDAENPGLWRGFEGYWDFSLGATGLTAHDLFGGGRNGTLVNGVTWVGEGVNFNAGNSQYIGLDTITMLGEMSIFCRIKLDDKDTFSSIISNSSSGTQKSFELTIYQGRLIFYWNNTEVERTVPILSANRWHDIVAVRSGSAGAWTASIYLDGAFVSSGVTAVNPNSGGGTSIGKDGTGNTKYIDGTLAKLGLTSRALNPSEIMTLHQDQYALIRRRTKTYSFYQAPVGGNPWYYNLQQEQVA